MFEWIKEYYDNIIAAITPILAAIIGLFSVQKKQVIKGNNNNQFQSDEKINNDNSFNQNHINNSPNTRQNNYYGPVYNQAPHAAESAATPSSSSLTDDTLQDCKKSVVKKNIPELNEMLAKSIAEKTQEPKKSIVKEAIEKSIIIVKNLDENLIKILAMCFLFGRINYRKIQSQEQLFEAFLPLVQHFKNTDATESKFEYLEENYCGKLEKFRNKNLIKLIATEYKFLFIREIPINQVLELNLPMEIVDLCFAKKDKSYYIPNSYSTKNIMKNTPISIDNHEFILPEALKQQLKNLYLKNVMEPEEIKPILLENIKDFNVINELWERHYFCNFSLKHVGIAIAISYSHANNLGEFNIDAWIN